MGILLAETRSGQRPSPLSDGQTGCTRVANRQQGPADEDRDDVIVVVEDRVCGPHEVEIRQAKARFLKHLALGAVLEALPSLEVAARKRPCPVA
jgi:hypothetical protein